MKVYISGPISNCVDDNKPAFDRMAKKLRDMGHAVINPHDLDLIDRVKTWEENLRRDIKYLMDCDAVVLLQGWEESKGALLEIGIAYDLGMPIYHVNNTGTLIITPIVMDKEITPLLPSSTYERI